MATKRKRQTSFQRGDRVNVQFGINRFSGVVVRYDDGGGLASVLVRLDPDDDSTEPFVSTFAAENVTLADSQSLTGAR